ncbi:hypothetical protein P3W45_000172 [Vairimorpha bombi]|jgi:hypothetical protein
MAKKKESVQKKRDMVKSLQKKKNELIDALHKKLQNTLSKIPSSILNLPILSIKDALLADYEGAYLKIVDNNKKMKRQSTVSLNFGEQYTYDGKIFLDSKGKVKNDSLDKNLKNLLKNAKKIADRMGKDMSLFIE